MTRDKLDLNASIVGNLVFQPKDIVSIELCSNSIMDKGIKITHNIENYPAEVIFSTTGNPAVVLGQIKKTGFTDNKDGLISEADALFIQQQQQAGSFPIKKPVAFAIVAFWVIILASDFLFFFTSHANFIPLGNGFLIAISILLLVAVFSLISKDFSQILLKKGKSIEHIDKFLYFWIVISVLMLLVIWVVKNF